MRRCSLRGGTGNSSLEIVLNQVPNQFKTRFPHQYDEFYSQDAFFYLDDGQDMFVQPSAYVWGNKWHKAPEVSPAWLQNMDRIKSAAMAMF